MLSQGTILENTSSRRLDVNLELGKGSSNFLSMSFFKSKVSPVPIGSSNEQAHQGLFLGSEASSFLCQPVC